MRWLVLVVVAAAALAGAPRAARADGAVALLPLDAEPRFEIYGRPVASEVARALVAGGIDVVVVGPRAAVPERARLIVDGKITAAPGDGVVVSLRIRDRETGTVTDTLQSDATALTSIDRAAADLSERALPTIRARLAAIAAALTPPPPPAAGSGSAAPLPAKPRPFVVAVSADDAADQPLQAALAAATDAWLRAHHREPRAVPPAALEKKTAAATVSTQGSGLGLALEILGYTIEPGRVALARARVHVRLADTTHVVFDRVIVTDTIVGDRDQPAAQLAARVAAEVIAILTPNAAREAPEL